MPTDTPYTSDPASDSASEPRSKVHLPVVAEQRSEHSGGEARGETRRRHPPWIKVKLPTRPTFFEVRTMVRELALHTVCESASCPNIGECWSRRALTIMILGDICTRSCRFCDVTTGRPLPPDPDEPRRVAEMLAKLDLEHTVITCVDRDDLADGGAAHWAETIARVKQACPDMSLEVLTGDFKGQTEHVDVVLAAAPDVFAHNLETVPRLSRQVRVQASYERSYRVLEHARGRGAITKTGLMLGLGETEDEVAEVLEETRELGVDIITLGQYLQPSKKHLPVARYVPPEEFEALGNYARELGFPHVEAGPLVRSSYHADGQADLVRAITRR
jgi:lipoyl synthase